MNPRLILLFTRYKDKIEEIDPSAFPNYDKCGRDHLLNLCTEAMDRLYNNTMPYGKACRWLGFVQGILCSMGKISVDEERDFTRPIFSEEPK